MRTLLAVPLLVLATAAGAQAAAVQGSLTITYWPHGKSASATTWSLRCDPARGTHPARRRACAELTRHPADLHAATRACTLMPTRTSPQARIAGTWSRGRVDRSYRIGCPGWSDLRVALTGK